MNHQEIFQALGALHDSELSGQVQREVRAHLDLCSGCRESYKRWGQVSQTLAHVSQRPTAEQTESFILRVMERLEPAPSLGLAAWLDFNFLGRWMIPALSFSLALFFVSIFLSGPESVAPMDMLLLMDGHSREIGRMVLPPDPASSDNLMDSIMENR